MNHVTICHNPFRADTWREFDTDNVCELLVQQFGTWPRGAKIFHTHVALNCEVTPRDEIGVIALENMKGSFYVLVFPELPILAAFAPLLMSIAISTVVSLLASLFRSSPSVKNQQQTSPNNQLGDRQNRERINERIEDIYGEVWSTPTLIQQPYRIFSGNKEIEYAYMCVGRGTIDISRVRDDLTPFEDIDGGSCEFYGPDTSPNSGDEPILRIGTAINTPIYNVKRYASANGQVLRAPNANKFKADNNVSFVSADSIMTSADIDFSDYFAVGSVSSPTHITIANSSARDPGGVHPALNLDGTYEIAAISSNEIVLTNPSAVNANWSSLAAFTGGASTYGSPTLTSNDDRWIGPFTIQEYDVSQIWLNFICPNGLFELDKDANQHTMDVQVQVGIQAINAAGTPVGDEVLYSGVIVGSSEVRTLRGMTLRCVLPAAGPCRVRARRFSSTDLRDNWTVVDQTQWKDLYAVSPVSQLHFGNVTTVQVVMWPTQDALAIKTRKFNCLVGRRIPFYRPEYWAQGPEPATDNSTRGTWNPTSRELIWMSARPSAVTAKIATWTDSGFSEVTLTGIDSGNSGGVNPTTLFVDDTSFYICQGSGYDTAKWYRFSRSGGAPTGSYGGIGVFSTPYSNPYNTDFGYIDGTQYIFHRRGSSVTRISKSTLQPVDTQDWGTGANGELTHDANGNTWGFIGSGAIGKIDWSASTTAQYWIGITGTPICMRYCAEDNSLLIMTQTSIFKFDIGTETITDTISSSSSWNGMSEVGSDGNFMTESAIYDAVTFDEVATFDLADYPTSGPWTGFGYNKALFLCYDVAMNRFLGCDIDAQVWAINLTPGGSYNMGTLVASKNAADILFAIATDPYIGNRSINELDHEQIYAAIGPGGANQQYFGTPLCSEFCFTFDDSKVSFEEMAQDVGSAAFSQVYRIGNIIKVLFERTTSTSTLIFNHRNKLPGSETRTVRFGLPNDFDGVQADFIDPHKSNQPDMDATNTYFYPEDQTAKAPKKVALIGVRNNVQAKLLGWRMFNKLKYQNIATEFIATQEAAPAILKERILIADNTRSDTKDGFIVSQVGLIVELSQPLTFEVGRTYTIFLQHYDNTVESMTITEGVDEYHVVLAGTPTLPLVVDKENFQQTTYLITSDAPTRDSAFLLEEKTPKDGMTYELKAINYDSRYYSHDTDFINEILVENVNGGYGSGYNGGGGGGTGDGGYTQIVDTVFVDGRTMPWNKVDNPSYDYGINDGRAPIVVDLHVNAGATVNIAADAPGEPTPLWRWPGHQSNTVRCSDSRPWVDANGQSDAITGTTNGSTGHHFPTYFMVGQYALGLGGLCGAFAHRDINGKYIVDQPISIGFGDNFTVPAGATHLLLGIDDDKFGDNIGGFQVVVTQLGAQVVQPPIDTTVDPGTNQDYYIITANGV